MNTYQKRRNPAGAGFQSRKHNNIGRADYTRSLHALYGVSKVPTSAKLPTNWRDRLPDPATYYAQHVEELTGATATGWASGLCPFHPDHNRSLSVNLAGERGHWRCHAACGGGDMVGFHMRRSGLAFKQAVRELIGSRP